MALALREYQVKDVEFMVSRSRMILANEPGLGKTAETLLALRALGVSSALVLGPKVSLGVWKDEAERWLQVSSLLYIGTPLQRKLIWQEYLKQKPLLLITNYALVEEVLSLCQGWQAIICDEVHLAGLLNRKTRTFATLKRAYSRHLFLLTGTPVRRGPQDLWALLNLIDSRSFSSYWRFIEEHCITFEDPFGLTIEGRPKNVVKFASMLSQYMVRRTKKQVLSELPDKVRQPIPLQLAGEQKRLYDDLASNMIADLGTEGSHLLVTPNRISQLLRLRQILVTPRLVGSPALGVALEALEELAVAELSSGRALVVFTPFRKAIPFIVEILEALQARVYVVHGGLPQEQVHSSTQAFQLGSGPRALVCTIKSGASFTAHAASTAIFVGCEWSAIENLQAEDRLHRLGQKVAVHVYYLLHRQTVDEAILEVLNNKQRAANWILSPEVMLDQVWRGAGCNPKQP